MMGYREAAAAADGLRTHLLRHSLPLSWHFKKVAFFERFTSLRAAALKRHES
jgi:hypothetical protein